MLSEPICSEEAQRCEALLHLARVRKLHLAERADAASFHWKLAGPSRNTLRAIRARKVRRYQEWLHAEMAWANQQYPGIVVNRKMMP